MDSRTRSSSKKSTLARGGAIPKQSMSANSSVTGQNVQIVEADVNQRTLSTNSGAGLSDITNIGGPSQNQQPDLDFIELMTDGSEIGAVGGLPRTPVRPTNTTNTFVPPQQLNVRFPNSSRQLPPVDESDGEDEEMATDMRHMCIKAMKRIHNRLNSDEDIRGATLSTMIEMLKSHYSTNRSSGEQSKFNATASTGEFTIIGNCRCII